MSDLIREAMADLPLANMVDRPPGMLAIRRADVPEEQRAAVDAWVEAHGGRIAQDSIFKVHNGKSPAGDGGAEFYVIPPAAFNDG